MLQIDWTRCEGHGLCAALLPERITRDEWGFPVLHDVPDRPGEEHALRRAVTACPALALRLTQP
ncbi:MAG: ferredoxin [Pseudonocardiales bacterium]|jgi:ferredoxin|nr:ferredoxin [Pseudonocardiales bacterium]